MRPSLIVLSVLFVPSLLADEKSPAMVMTQEEFLAIKTGKTPEAEAKKKWEGKRAEITVSVRASYQELTSRTRMGQTLVGFRFPTDGKILFLAAYFKGEANRAFLKNRKLTDKTPFKIRGTVMISYQSDARIWLEDADVVKE